jgi:hypothetical protein
MSFWYLEFCFVVLRGFVVFCLVYCNTVARDAISMSIVFCMCGQKVSQVLARSK